MISENRLFLPPMIVGAHVVTPSRMNPLATQPTKRSTSPVCSIPAIDILPPTVDFEAAFAAPIAFPASPGRIKFVPTHAVKRIAAGMR